MKTPILETERVILRPLASKDAKDMEWFYGKDSRLDQAA